MAIDVEDLFRLYGALVVRRCRQLLKDEDEALEVTQQVFVELLRRHETLEVRNPSSLLYRMATNLSLNHIRDRKREPALQEEELVDQLASMEEAASRLEARSVLRRLFAKHHDSTRVIAVLYFVDGLTLKEVARHVEMSVPGVRKRIDGLRRSLAGMLQP